MATVTVRKRTGREPSRATIVPKAGGWSQIVSADARQPGPVDPHTLLEGLLAQQIANDRPFNTLVGAEAD